MSLSQSPCPDVGITPLADVLPLYVRGIKSRPQGAGYIDLVPVASFAPSLHRLDGSFMHRSLVGD